MSTGVRLPGIRWRRVVELGFFLAGLTLLVIVVSRFPLADIGGACLRIGPWVALMPFVALAWIACNARGLQTLMGGRVRWRDLVWMRLVGDGYNNLLPLAGLGGEPFKLKYLTRFIPSADALTALVRDRLVENAVGFLFTATWLAYSLGHFELPQPLRLAIAVYVGAATLIAGTYLVVLSTQLPGRTAAAIVRHFGAGGCATERLPKARLARAMVWYLCGRLLGLVEVGALLYLLGLGLQPAATGFAYSTLHAAGFISFAIPQGLGVFEGTSVYLFDVLHLAGALGVAFVLARRGRLLMVSLLGVTLHVVGGPLWRVRAARRTSMASTGPAASPDVT